MSWKLVVSVFWLWPLQTARKDSHGPGTQETLICEHSEHIVVQVEHPSDGPNGDPFKGPGEDFTGDNKSSQEFQVTSSSEFKTDGKDISNPVKCIRQRLIWP